MELSFIPYKLAARPDLQSSWYHPNVSPPRDYAKWDDLVTQFTKHLADRYGIDEVANWSDGSVTLQLPVNGLAIIQVR
ncbi:MAG: hypothetical protein P4M04_15420 [Acidobacteriota bacterium]|nr:hypothetical protein [Acidobacteriota bacterium]